jgi:hypothetical protein
MMERGGGEMTCSLINDPSSGADDRIRSTVKSWNNLSYDCDCFINADPERIRVFPETVLVKAAEKEKVGPSKRFHLGSPNTHQLRSVW